MKRKTNRRTTGTKLYAVRGKNGKFKDIKQYKHVHGAGLKKKK